MKLPLTCLFGVWMMTVSAFGQTWTQVRPGLELINSSFVDGGRSVRYALVRCDPKRRNIHIVDVAHNLGKETAMSAFSVAAVSVKTKAVVVMNAGSTASYNFPSPVGWLRVKGVQVSAPALRARQAAALCLSGNAVSIVELPSPQALSCIEAVQRGPFLPKTFQPVRGFSDGSYVRSVAAVDREGRLLLLATKDPASFSSLVSFLYSTQSGLDVQSAFGLDSASSSGMLVNINTRSPDGILVVGNVNGLVASAIEVD